MTRTFLIALVLMPLSIFAQDRARVEVFGGYSFLHIDTEGVTGNSLDRLCNRIRSGACAAGTFHVHPNANGWNAAVEVTVHRSFGLKADFSGHYLTPLTLSSAAQAIVASTGVTGFPPNATNYAFLFGPAAHKRFSRYEVFGHALVGFDRFSLGTIGSPPFTVRSVMISPVHVNIANTGLGVAFGGGLDLKVTDRFSIRVGQIDYLYTQHNFNFILKTVNTHQNNIRASAGVVVAFGTGPEPVTRPQALQAGAISIPTIGVTVIAPSSGEGAEITRVVAGSPAEQAGLGVGDVLNRVGAMPVSNPISLTSQLEGKESGSKVVIGFLRKGYWQTETTVTIQRH